MTRHLEDWELDCLLGGDGTPEMEAALTGNPTNQARFAQIQQEEGMLVANFFRIECPTALELGEWHLQLLDSDYLKTIGSHLKSCLHCQEEVAAIKPFVAHARYDFKRTSSDMLKRIKITLANILDAFGGQLTLTPALRGRKSPPALYAADDYQLSLTPQEQMLVGTFVGTPITGSVSLKQGPTIFHETTITENAFTFPFKSIRSGNYDMVISTPEAELVVPALRFDY